MQLRRHEYIYVFYQQTALHIVDLPLRRIDHQTRKDGVDLPDEETLEDFLRRVGSDVPTGSRLAVLDILFPESPAVRQELAKSISKRTSPLVDIALAFSQHITKF